jgi:hypothetical protein
VSKDPLTSIRMNCKSAKFVPVGRFSNNPANSCMARWVAVMVSPPGLNVFYATQLYHYLRSFSLVTYRRTKYNGITGSPHRIWDGNLCAQEVFL